MSLARCEISAPAVAGADATAGGRGHGRGRDSDIKSAWRPPAGGVSIGRAASVRYDVDVTAAAGVAPVNHRHGMPRHGRVTRWWYADTRSRRRSYRRAHPLLRKPAELRAPPVIASGTRNRVSIARRLPAREADWGCWVIGSYLVVNSGAVATRGETVIDTTTDAEGVGTTGGPAYGRTGDSSPRTRRQTWRAPGRPARASMPTEC